MGLYLSTQAQQWATDGGPERVRDYIQANPGVEADQVASALAVPVDAVLWALANPPTGTSFVELARERSRRPNNT
jgi:hypothetical protein